MLKLVHENRNPKKTAFVTTLLFSLLLALGQLDTTVAISLCGHCTLRRNNNATKPLGICQLIF